MPEGQEEEVSAASSDEVRRLDLFGGLIQEYRAVAACRIGVSAPHTIRTREDTVESHHELEECDLVMKGGITSGVVYPSAVRRLSKIHRFRNTGGALPSGPSPRR